MCFQIIGDIADVLRLVDCDVAHGNSACVFGTSVLGTELSFFSVSCVNGWIWNSVLRIPRRAFPKGTTGAGASVTDETARGLALAGLCPALPPREVRTSRPECRRLCGLALQPLQCHA